MIDPSDLPQYASLSDGLDLSLLVESPAWVDHIPDLEACIHRILMQIPITLKERKEVIPLFQGITILLTTDIHVRGLNRQFRGKDVPTNVLSFPTYSAEELQDMGENTPHDNSSFGGEVPLLSLGDIALAFETIAQETQDQHKTLTNHMTHLIIHGVLHLLGYDHMDDDEQGRMESLEIAILRALDINNPYEIYEDPENASHH